MAVHSGRATALSVLAVALQQQGRQQTTALQLEGVAASRGASRLLAGAGGVVAAALAAAAAVSSTAVVAGPNRVMAAHSTCPSTSSASSSSSGLVVVVVVCPHRLIRSTNRGVALTRAHSSSSRAGVMGAEAPCREAAVAEAAAALGVVLPEGTAATQGEAVMGAGVVEAGRTAATGVAAGVEVAAAGALVVVVVVRLPSSSMAVAGSMCVQAAPVVVQVGICRTGGVGAVAARVRVEAGVGPGATGPMGKSPTMAVTVVTLATCGEQTTCCCCWLFVAGGASHAAPPDPPPLGPVA